MLVIGLIAGAKAPTGYLRLSALACLHEAHHLRVPHAVVRVLRLRVRQVRRRLRARSFSLLRALLLAHGHT